MYSLKKPSPEQIQRFLASQQDQPFTYAAVGATQGDMPGDFTVDHNRIKLGSGHETYERAIVALRRWQQFDLGWVKIEPDSTPLEVGGVVAIKAKTFGFWTLSACRIVYLINEEGPTKKFGFAYGTLTDHVECGEERFTIELDARDDSVSYDILAFSRPQHPLVKLARPLARMLQKRFAKDSKRRMLTAVELSR